MKTLTYTNVIFRMAIIRSLLRISFFLIYFLTSTVGFTQDKVLNVGVVTGCFDPGWGQFANSILAEARVLLKLIINWFCKSKIC